MTEKNYKKYGFQFDVKTTLVYVNTYLMDKNVFELNVVILL